ncbi:hypothetical protein MJO28_017769 [Puccinia striiformis f. sp. tritici]|nr:hypothetical protein MJO28_017769 [Puccinia striiformis f. sp. tritici]
MVRTLTDPIESHQFPLLSTSSNLCTTRYIPPSIQSIQFLSVLVAVVLHSQSATAIVPTFRCTGRGSRTAGYCVQPGTETQSLSESSPP